MTLIASSALVGDIAHGEVDWADILFLVATVLFVVGAVVAYIPRTIWATVIAAGLACTSLALMLL